MKGMKVGIVGVEAEGKAAYRYWTDAGCEVTLLDYDPSKTLPEGAKSVLGPDYLKNLDRFNLIVRSPGIRPWLIETKRPVTSVTKEFFEQCPARIIGVTGTKGKGTTSTLITKILEAAGKKVWLGGNIGTPALEFLPRVRANHLVVLELSSFQLIDLERSPRVAVCLMIMPEHMDWHRDMREYVAAKGNIFWHQKAGDLAVYDADNEFSTDVAQLSRGTRVPYMHAPGAQVVEGRIVIEGTDICGVDEVGLMGAHNLENVCAAVTATWALIDHNPQPVRVAVKAFKGLPHRIERLGRVEGVAFINDSYATNPAATSAALRAVAGRKVLIVGGKDRKQTFGDLATAIVANDVRAVVLIGETGPLIAQALDGVGFTAYQYAKGDMRDIAGEAMKLATTGDTVLLSPGCASFDMFENFTKRGELFQAAATSLGARLP